MIGWNAKLKNCNRIPPYIAVFVCLVHHKSLLPSHCCLHSGTSMSELLLLSGDLPSLQVHYSSHLSPSQTILIETVSGTHNEQPLNGLVTAMHSHDWKSTFKVTTQVMHFHFIKKIVPECINSFGIRRFVNFLK